MLNVAKNVEWWFSNRQSKLFHVFANPWCLSTEAFVCLASIIERAFCHRIVQQVERWIAVERWNSLSCRLKKHDEKNSSEKFHRDMENVRSHPYCVSSFMSFSLYSFFPSVICRESSIFAFGRQRLASDTERFIAIPSPSPTLGSEIKQHHLHFRGRFCGLRRFHYFPQSAEERVSFMKSLKVRKNFRKPTNNFSVRELSKLAIYSTRRKASFV